MIRISAIFVSILFLGCGAEPESCDLRCLQELRFNDCCECLVEKECLNTTSEQCVDTLIDGDLITISIGCGEDPERCGSQCDYVISPVGEFPNFF